MSKHALVPFRLELQSVRIKTASMLKRFRSQARATKTGTLETAGTMTPNLSHNTFFDLPAELRNVIYEEVAGDCPLTLKSKTGSAPPSLLVTSQRCREEYLPILLGTAKIQVAVIDMNFTKLIDTIDGLDDSARKALASNPSLLIVLRVKKCGSDVYGNLRMWCQYQAQYSAVIATGTGQIEAPVRASWHYIIDPATETNAAQLDWYCGRVRVLKERSNDEGMKHEVQRVQEVLEGERTGKSELGSWNMGFGDAYALYVANAARRT